ncbi:MULTISPECIES: DUF1353 domain-containing protein [unclassified Leifsonia]|uniref:DUF1353 domain-containing protein n=1 Tax=unclassified Leifsonia TaxID=2663824 RepID=UPI0006FF9C5F|nr:MULTISPECIES: DUF1353 domain-containing protein [unclassified Leifsonia]KQX08077.1 hypothetical protein ASC59_10365 [Leifsonia sp. Root1293]KRA12358.1 hypothetical protein ASD61_10365 [Leifsonia sp. Root60]
MPFITEDGEPLASIEIGQVPPAGYLFQLRRGIGYREPGTDGVVWAPAHAPEPHPTRQNSTDLASVPPLLWSFIASYGRQSAPAIVHDHRSEVAAVIGDGGDPRAALEQRREDDRIFLVGLREQRVPLLRAWLMWGWVSAERYLRHARPFGLLLLLQILLSLAVIAAGIVLAITVHPAWLPVLLLPFAASFLWGRNWPMTAVLSYGSAVIAPLLIVQLVALLPFRLLEFLVELLSGGQPTQVFRPTLRPADRPTDRPAG